MSSILVVDDDEAVRASIDIVLTSAGHIVTTAAGGREALSACESAAYDVVLVDMLMPEMDGLETIKALRAAGCIAKIGAMSGGWHDSNIDLLHIARHLGADATISKPFIAGELDGFVSAMLDPH